MNLKSAEKIASALLYEGYILYPYRPSSVKNQRRFNFGVLMPQSYSEAQRGSESSLMQTECIVHGEGFSMITIKVRFLQMRSREVWAASPARSIAQCVGQSITEEKTAIERDRQSFQLVQSLKVNKQSYQTWQEAVEREIVEKFFLADLKKRPKQMSFSFPVCTEIETLRNDAGKIIGEIVRRQEALEFALEISVKHCEEQTHKLMIRVLNLTKMENQEQASRDEALNYSLLSAHTIIGVQSGEFVSLLDPPEEYRSIAASCCNIGTWPVLAGENGDRDLILSSPIILYDYPQIAPESDGDLFDGTEIDEILLLRILTLTEDEKREMRSADERSRKILERAEALSTEQLMKLHGVLRNMRTIEE